MTIPGLFRILVAIILLARPNTPPAAHANSPFSFTYDSTQEQWDMSNGLVHAVFHLDGGGKFGLIQFDNKGGNVWTAPAVTTSSPVSIQLGSITYDSTTAFQLIEQYAESPNAGTERQVVMLED